MASGTNLVMSFYDGEMKTVNFTYKYADPQVQASSVKALSQAMITNGSIYANTPSTAKGAKLVTTIETPISLDD